MNVLRNLARMVELVLMELMNTAVLVLLDTLDLTVKQVIHFNLVNSLLLRISIIKSNY